MSDETTPQDSAAAHDLGPMCYGFAADGVWMDTHYGWVIPDEARIDRFSRESGLKASENAKIAKNRSEPTAPTRQVLTGTGDV
jgi:hypothetical protein